MILKKIIPYFLVIAMVVAFSFGLCCPASASVGDINAIVSFWDYLHESSGGLGVEDYLGHFFAENSGCSHNGGGSHVWVCDSALGLVTNNFVVYCSQCGELYSDYMNDSYDESVSSLPASGISSVGDLYWQPTWADSSNNNVGTCKVSSTNNLTIFKDGNSSSASGATLYTSVSGAVASGRITPSTYTSSPSIQNVYLSANFTNSKPVPGIYSSNSVAIVCSNGQTVNWNISNYLGHASCTFSPFISGFTSFTFAAYTPVFRIVPTTTINVVSGDTYNTSNRVTNFSMNYIDQSTNTTYNNVTIVNEATNNYYDVTTGENKLIEDWTYDYATRTYHLTLAGGALVDVNFGLDNLTITSGGVDLDLNYTVERPGCTHNYVLSDIHSATCEENGYNIYTCTLCNASYTEVLFASGHNYIFNETVEPECTIDESTLVCPGCNETANITHTLNADGQHYDCVCADCNESWQVAGTITAGYDSYICANCQGEYKDYTGEGVDRPDGAYWSWLQRWLANFKEWLGDEFAAIKESISGSGGGSGGSSGGEAADTPASVTYEDGNVVVNNDYTDNITYTNEDGEEENISIRNIFKKFGFIKDIYNIAVELVDVIDSDRAYAEDYDLSFIPSDEEAEVSANSLDGEPVLYSVATFAAADSDVMEDESIMLTANALDGNPNIPSITMNLGAANSHYGYAYGGTVEVLDLSWYTPYKSTVDNIAGGFLWVLFVWGLFKATPGIVSGASITSNRIEDISSGTKGGGKKQ